MIAPSLPENENLRQKAVEKYELLDTLSEESYDNITSLMSYICDAPISLITLLDKDRNFLKSHHGVPFNESPREISFCGHAINQEEPMMIVEDARKDERFHDNALVSEHSAVFYAGVPLVNPDGYKLGTLCVYDVKPRTLTLEQKVALKAMAKQVIRLFEERYKNIQLQHLRERLEIRNKNLERFAGIVSHDLKSPLAQITSLTELLEADIKDHLTEETTKYLDYIKESSDSLRGYIDGILKFYKADDLLKRDSELVRVDDLLADLKHLYSGDLNTDIRLNSEISELHTNKAALTQILVNLVSNSVKYNDKARTMIDISIVQDDHHYIFTVSDNGPGIPEEYRDRVFDLFETIQQKDKHGMEGTGIGLATVKKVVNSLGGEVSIASEPDGGTQLQFTLRRS